MPRVHHTARARRDLIDIWIQIGSVNPAAAEAVYNRIEARIAILKRFARAGRFRPENSARRQGFSRAPFLILYRIIPDGVQIVRVLHGARNIDRTLFIEGIE